MGKLITVVNQKGGVGKTTTSFMLAYILSKKGYSVLLKDADIQGSVTSWYENAESCLNDGEEVPFDFEITNKTSIGRKKEKYDFIVVDTPPQETIIMDAALKVADYVVVPTAPTALDLERVFEVLRIVEVPYKVLFTQINTNTVTYRSVKEMFNEQEIEYFNSAISKREAVVKSIGSFPNEDATRDYVPVVDELLVDLGGEL